MSNKSTGQTEGGKDNKKGDSSSKNNAGVNNEDSTKPIAVETQKSNEGQRLQMEGDMGSNTTAIMVAKSESESSESDLSSTSVKEEQSQTRKVRINQMSRLFYFESDSAAMRARLPHKTKKWEAISNPMRKKMVYETIFEIGGTIIGPGKTKIKINPGTSMPLWPMKTRFLSLNELMKDEKTTEPMDNKNDSPTESKDDNSNTQQNTNPQGNNNNNNNNCSNQDPTPQPTIAQSPKDVSPEESPKDPNNPP